MDKPATTIPTAPALLNHQEAALIEEHVRRLMCVMGFEEAKVNCCLRHGAREEDGGHLRIAINAGAAGRMLIGARGNHLAALQHVIRSLLRHQIKKSFRVTVDVNNYLAGRERNVLRLAEEAARKVRRTGQAITLPPMGAADRRMVHNSLSFRSDVTTESRGDEPRRRVVIRPVFI